MDPPADIPRKPRSSRAYKPNSSVKQQDDKIKRRSKQKINKPKLKKAKSFEREQVLSVEDSQKSVEAITQSCLESRLQQLIKSHSTDIHLESTNTQDSQAANNSKLFQSSSSLLATKIPQNIPNGNLPAEPVAYHSNLTPSSSESSKVCRENHVTSQDIASSLSKTMTPMRISQNSLRDGDSDSTLSSYDSRQNLDRKNSLLAKRRRSSPSANKQQQLAFLKKQMKTNDSTKKPTAPLNSLESTSYVSGLNTDGSNQRVNVSKKSDKQNMKLSSQASRKHPLSSASSMTSLIEVDISQQSDNNAKKAHSNNCSVKKQKLPQKEISANSPPLNLDNIPASESQKPAVAISAAELPKNRVKNKIVNAKRLKKLVETQQAIVKPGRKKSPSIKDIKPASTNEPSKPAYSPQFLIDPSKVASELTVADLRDLVLYLMTSESRAPTWIGIKQNFAIPRVVSVYIPSLSCIAFPTDDNKDTSSIDISNYQPQEFKAPWYLDFFSTVFSHAFIVSAPGNKHTVFSPTDTFLWMMPNSQEKRKLNLKGNTNNEINGKIHSANRDRKCEPINLILSLEELLLHKYCVHPDTVGAKLAASKNPEILQPLGSDWVNTYPRDDSHSFQKKNESKTEPKVFAIDCEMCKSYDQKVLTRVTVVAENGEVVIDELVKPDVPITDYVTQFSGITAEMLENVNTSLRDVQRMICQLISSTDIMIGHSLENDLDALKIRHPRIIDTAVTFQKPNPGTGPYSSKPALRNLTKQYLKRTIQTGGSNGHDSVEDALACLDLYKLKLQHGVNFGLQDGLGKISLADRLAIAEPKPVIVNSTVAPKYRVGVVDYGVPGWAASSAHNISSCSDDDDVVQNTINTAKQHSFTWARMRELELLSETMKTPRKGRGSFVTSTPVPILSESREEPIGSEPTTNSNKDESTEICPEVNRTEHHIDCDDSESQFTLIASSPENVLVEAYSRLNSRLKTLYSSLPANTALLIWTGQGDKNRMMELHAKRHQFNYEYKTKKWSEIECCWTDEDNRELSKATEKARKGLAFLVVKTESQV